MGRFACFSVGSCLFVCDTTTLSPRIMGSGWSTPSATLSGTSSTRAASARRSITAPTVPHVEPAWPRLLQMTRSSATLAPPTADDALLGCAGDRAPSPASTEAMEDACDDRHDDAGETTMKSQKPALQRRSRVVNPHNHQRHIRPNQRKTPTQGCKGNLRATSRQRGTAVNASFTVPPHLLEA